jgi:hypothetical protein
LKAKNPDRQERLAAALRENLKRRKARDRAMADAPKDQSGADAEPRPNKAQNPQ